MVDAILQCGCERGDVFYKIYRTNLTEIHVGDGTVTFSSSDTNVASVNSATGEVTITPGATAGQTVNIMATISESETNDYIYYSKEASYTLKLTPATTQAEIDGFSPGSW